MNNIYFFLNYLMYKYLKIINPILISMSSFEQKTGNNASAPTSTTTPSTGSKTAPSSYKLPSDTTLQHAAKLSIVEDKPILFDYWTDSIDTNVLIGVKDNGEKMLVKSADEYTSPIVKMYKSMGEYIIITENSIYIVVNTISNRKIS